MKLLLDQNISYKVVRLLQGVFDEVQHVNTLGLTDVPDVEIWEYAKLHNYTIVTFDSDFTDLSILKGSLPKIIWLKFGNAPNLKVANKLISNVLAVKEFLTNSSNETLVLEIN